MVENIPMPSFKVERQRVTEKINFEYYSINKSADSSEGLRLRVNLIANLNSATPNSYGATKFRVTSLTGERATVHVPSRSQKEK